MNISINDFDNFVTTAIDSIDPQFKPHLAQVPVIIEDTPDPRVCQNLKLNNPQCLLGLFRGTPLNKRSVLSDVTTNQIILYRKNLLDFCTNHQQLQTQIRKTIIHELAHYLGFSENQIRQLHY
ncbi:MAG: metallopeptidase family protein [Planctomycetes bacterium]|nr:metallopeptidase family protein [Planctomycetota bacterium]